MYFPLNEFSSQMECSESDLVVVVIRKLDYQSKEGRASKPTDTEAKNARILWTYTKVRVFFKALLPKLKDIKVGYDYFIQESFFFPDTGRSDIERD